MQYCAPIPPPRSSGQKGFLHSWPALGPADSPSTALPAQNTNKGPSRCTEKARQSLTAPRGWLDRAGIQCINGASQLIMVQLVCRDQRRPLLPWGQGMRAKGCWLRRPEYRPHPGCPSRWHKSAGMASQFPATQHTGRQLPARRPKVSLGGD